MLAWLLHACQQYRVDGNWRSQTEMPFLGTMIRSHWHLTREISQCCKMLIHKSNSLPTSGQDNHHFLVHSQKRRLWQRERSKNLRGRSTDTGDGVEVWLPVQLVNNSWSRCLWGSETWNMSCNVLVKYVSQIKQDGTQTLLTYWERGWLEFHKKAQKGSRCVS